MLLLSLALAASVSIPSVAWTPDAEFRRSRRSSYAVGRRSGSSRGGGRRSAYSSGGSGATYYANCSAARAAGAAPVMRGDPGYSPKLDRDNDGVGCE